MDNPLLPISIVICLALSAYFSATETAISSVSRPRLKAIEESGDARAKTALRVTERYDDALSAILIGNNIVNIAASSVGTILCIDIFGESLGALMSTIIITLLVLTFGEILPKSMAKENSETIALWLRPAFGADEGIASADLAVCPGQKLVIGRFHKEDTPTVTEENCGTSLRKQWTKGCWRSTKGADPVGTGVQRYDGKRNSDPPRRRCRCRRGVDPAGSRRRFSV